MKTFHDAENREWVVNVSIGSIKDVRDLYKVDLCKFFDVKDSDSAAQKLLSDPPLMVDVIHQLCKRQCEDRKLSARDFGELFSCDVLEDAKNALIGAVIDFFPSSRQPTLKSWVNKAETLATEANQKLIAKIATLTIEDLTSSQTSTKSPE